MIDFTNYVPTKTMQEILEDLSPKNVDIQVDVFEEIILQDIAMGDDKIKIKLSRNLTKEFTDWIFNTIKNKEQVKVNIKGQTRSGKSQIGIRVCSLINKANASFGLIKDFNAQKIICGNQKILRQKLNNAEFGDFFQIDENAFANVGSGSFTEMQQLKDINNIIAKQNIQMIYITPQTFLPTGATSGLAYFGKDTKNWVSRFLLYSLKGTIPSLLGYVVFDVGKNFSENGCMIYKQIGGCTNPTRKKFEDIDKDFIYHSSAIDKTKINEENILNDGKTCPFYNICNSFNCQYEHIKDDWIAKEMKGGIGEREREKLEVAIMLFKEFATFNVDKGQFRLNAKNGKELKLKIKMKLPTLINTKYTGVEIDDIIQTTISLLDREFLEDTCKIIDFKVEDIINELMSKEPNAKEEMSNTPKDKVNDEIISQIRKDKKLYTDLIEYGMQLLEQKNKPIEIQKELNFDEEENTDLENG